MTKPSNAIREEIADNIRKIRGHFGTQAEFATFFNRTVPLDLKTTRGDLSKYENDINRIPADVYLKILSMKPAHVIL